MKQSTELPRVVHAQELPGVFNVQLRCKHCGDLLTLTVIGIDNKRMAAEVSLLAAKMDGTMESPEVVGVTKPDGVLMLAAPLSDDENFGGFGGFPPTLH